MGVDTTLHLPPQVEVRHVAEAIAILFGAKKRWYRYEDKIYHDTPQDKGWVEVEGVKVEPCSSSVEMVLINMPDQLFSQSPFLGDGWLLYYHFETESGERYMSGGSRSQRIALHRRLAQLFGGRVVYKDYSDKVNYRRPKPAWLGKHHDRQFHEMQLALWNLKPLTAAECQACVKWAAYGK